MCDFLPVTPRGPYSCDDDTEGKFKTVSYTIHVLYDTHKQTEVSTLTGAQQGGADNKVHCH